MMTETRLTIALIRSTGYENWLDFAIHIISSAGTKGIYTYTYEDAKGERKDIDLNIPPNMLDRLAWEEARSWLAILDISSFSDHQKLIDQGRMRLHRDTYIIETFVRRPDGQIELRILEIDTSVWERILKWETKYCGEFVFIEPVVMLAGVAPEK